MYSIIYNRNNCMKYSKLSHKENDANMVFLYYNSIAYIVAVVYGIFIKSYVWMSFRSGSSTSASALFNFSSLSSLHSVRHFPVRQASWQERRHHRQCRGMSSRVLNEYVSRVAVGLHVVLYQQNLQLKMWKILKMTTCEDHSHERTSWWVSA